MTAALLTRHKSAWSEAVEGVEVIPLRHTPDGAEKSMPTPLMREWPSAKGVMAQIKKIAGLILEGEEVRFGDAVIERFAPGAYTDWAQDKGDYATAHHRLQMCLVPSPGAVVISGGVSWQPPTYMLTWVSHEALHSTLNLGDYPFIRLVVDVEKPTVGED